MLLAEAWPQWLIYFPTLKKSEVASLLQGFGTSSGLQPPPSVPSAKLAFILKMAELLNSEVVAGVPSRQQERWKRGSTPPLPWGSLPHVTYNIFAAIDSNWSPGHTQLKGGSEMHFRLQCCLTKEDEGGWVFDRPLVISPHVNPYLRQKSDGKHGLTMGKKSLNFLHSKI